MTADGDYKKKLIEVALPLDEINAACKADKAVKTGTIRNLHKWFAPMPLPAWRALLFAALVDDPSDDEKRADLLALIKALVASGGDVPDPHALERAAAIIATQYPDGAPLVMDPFCGGGSTLVEAQRLGLRTYGSDLNPVPAVVSRALTETLPKVAGQPAIHAEGALPVDGDLVLMSGVGRGAQDGYEGLIADVNFYAEGVRAEAWLRLGRYFPHSPDESPIAWIWMRTVQCPNPACGTTTPLTSTWWLSKKPGELAWIEPSLVDGEVVLDVTSGRSSGQAPASPKVGDGVFVCVAPGCGATLDGKFLRAEGKAGRMGVRLAAVLVAEKERRVYRTPTKADEFVIDADLLDASKSSLPINVSGQGIRVGLYGMDSWDDIFTDRQLVVLSTFADLVAGVHAKVVADGGSTEWADAVTTVLGLVVGQASRYCSTQTFFRTRVGPSQAISAFGRNDLPMNWDFVETAMFGDSIGGWRTLVANSVRGIAFAPAGVGSVARSDARAVVAPGPALIATDPPYFDAIGYADLSDFFYIWHRRALKGVHPDLYSTMATPKVGELTAIPSHHGNDKEAARQYFIDGFTETFGNLKTSMAHDVPMLVVYASKEQKGGREEETRWSSILTAMVNADLEITGTWPIHGTTQVRLISAGTNAVATYVVMVCRPRPEGAGVCSLADFNRALRRELKVAVRDLQAAGILPVDLSQAAMGPGMQIYSRYSAVIDQSGGRVSVDEALGLINSALGEVLDDQEGELDAASRFAVAWWDQHGWGQGRFDLADKMVRPKGISVDDLVQADVISLSPGWVRLKGLGDLDRRWVPSTDKHPTAWEAVHHLADRLIDGGGSQEAGALLGSLGTLRDPAQALVYRLHDIAAKKGWVKDQERYNALIASWSDLLQVAAMTHSSEGGRLF